MLLAAAFLLGYLLCHRPYVVAFPQRAWADSMIPPPISVARLGLWPNNHHPNVIVQMISV